MQTAEIFAIERHRIERDGSGVRTLVGFAGCPLRCRFCINPHSWSGTGKAKHYSVEELMETVSVDSVYFAATGGGVTFGGGEPLLHANFIAEFIKSAPNTWNFAIETSLAVPFSCVETAAHTGALFIVDVKTLDADIYHAYTGGDVYLLKENLARLLELVGSERILARVPEIPHYADASSADKTAAALRRMGVTAIERFVYREPSRDCP